MEKNHSNLFWYVPNIFSHHASSWSSPRSKTYLRPVGQTCQSLRKWFCWYYKLRYSVGFFQWCLLVYKHLYTFIKPMKPWSIVRFPIKSIKSINPTVNQVVLWVQKKFPTDPRDPPSVRVAWPKATMMKPFRRGRHRNYVNPQKRWTSQIPRFYDFDRIFLFYLFDSFWGFAQNNGHIAFSMKFCGMGHYRTFDVQWRPLVHFGKGHGSAKIE